MEARIFDCVNNYDIDELKLLTDYPNFFKIEDASGHTVLQRAIIMNSGSIFDFLLSLDDCPINARNTSGRTALQVAQRIYCSKRVGEHMIYFLLKKGADIDWDSETIRVLHRALDCDDVDIANLLIEKGADLNCYDEQGQTPLNMLYKLGLYKNNWLAMMLYFDADPSIPDCDGYRVIDFAFVDGLFSKSMQQHLLLYFFDDYCTGYDIPVDNLFGLLQSDYSFVPEVLKHVTSVFVDEDRISSPLQTFFIKLFTIKPEYLKMLLEKFDYIIQDIIDASLECDFTKYATSKEMFLENFDLLLQSQFSSDIIQVINKTSIVRLFSQLQRSKVSFTELIESILIMLSYGANITDKDMEWIYAICGDCEFFRMLLHMDIKINRDSEENKYCYFLETENSFLKKIRCHYGIMPGLLYDIRTNLQTFLNGPYGIQNACNYFAHPKLKNCSYDRSGVVRGRIARRGISKKSQEEVECVPSVPLLVELARNEVRKFLVRKFKIKNCMQFYTLIKHLPIAEAHKKIITLETKLY